MSLLLLIEFKHITHLGSHRLRNPHVLDHRLHLLRSVTLRFGRKRDFSHQTSISPCRIQELDVSLQDRIRQGCHESLPVNFRRQVLLAVPEELPLWQGQK